MAFGKRKFGLAFLLFNLLRYDGAAATPPDSNNPPTSQCSAEADSLYPEIRSFVQLSPSQKRKKFPSKEWQIMAFSHIAEGLGNYSQCNSGKKEEVQQLLETIVVEALPFSPTSLPPATAEVWEQGLYVTHLNIILGTYKKVTGDQKYFPIQECLTQHLAQATLRDPQRHVRSYSNLPHKWPADQAATLYSLWLFDQQHGTTVSDEPIHQWLDYLKKHATDPQTGLPYSNITGKKDGPLPRGCALSWSIRYMASFAPAPAQDLWKKYKDHFYATALGVHGFREWPRGISRKADSDSGPIIQGLGTAASAFGVSAARAIGDFTTYQELSESRRAALAALEVLGSPSLRAASTSMMAKAIEFYTSTL